MARIDIVGGGVVGLCCALRLQYDGHAVALFDPGHAPSAPSAPSWGNAGHIATEQVAPLASIASLRSAPRRLFMRGGALDLPRSMMPHWLPFALRMMRASTPGRFRRGKAALTALMQDAMPAWERLTDDIGLPGLLRREGHFVVWQSLESGRPGSAAWQDADIGKATCRPASAREIARLAAVTSAPVAVALRFEGSGQISDLGLLAQSLKAAVRAAGGTVVRDTARVRIADGAAQVVGHDSDLVLVAAGVRSGELMAALGHKTPIIAERGYHIRGRADRCPADLPPIVFEDRSVIVTRYVDCIQASSFVELGAADAPPDRRKWERLERHVVELGLPMAPPFSRWMGSRPTLPDYLPAIGRSALAPNLCYAFGHQHLGLTLAPTTADIIADLIGDRSARLDLRPFDLGRFA